MVVVRRHVLWPSYDFKGPFVATWDAGRQWGISDGSLLNGAARDRLGQSASALGPLTPTIGISPCGLPARPPGGERATAAGERRHWQPGAVRVTVAVTDLQAARERQLLRIRALRDADPHEGAGVRQVSEEHPGGEALTEDKLRRHAAQDLSSLGAAAIAHMMVKLGVGRTIAKVLVDLKPSLSAQVLLLLADDDNIDLQVLSFSPYRAHATRVTLAAPDVTIMTLPVEGDVGSCTIWCEACWSPQEGYLNGNSFFGCDAGMRWSVLTLRC
ncbi:hypothetical protein CYMTET_34729 [Cymbomonas tetramitiformis]|uniref:Uncharacterized protein n=1 Tax=Cymbomonas tetramitiformis TaxID=36881 RepID=A0AAE0FAJ5_9CHLO|nr:hypothetical protein CYMTET_34729 [Cymbomonas tetramitiformis]